MALSSVRNTTILVYITIKRLQVNFICSLLMLEKLLCTPPSHCQTRPLYAAAAVPPYLSLTAFHFTIRKVCDFKLYFSESAMLFTSRQKINVKVVGALAFMPSISVGYQVDCFYRGVGYLLNYNLGDTFRIIF